jgi:hypothetical protein
MLSVAQASALISALSVVLSARSKGHPPHAADHRTPQPEFPRRDGFLDHRRRAGTRGDADAHEPKGAPWPELEHSVSRSGICREHESTAHPNRFAANRLASSTSSAYRDAAGGAMRVLSAFCFVSPLPSKVYAVSSAEEKPKTRADTLQGLTPSKEKPKTRADTLQGLTPSTSPIKNRRIRSFSISQFCASYRLLPSPGPYGYTRPRRVLCRPCYPRRPKPGRPSPLPPQQVR